ncbi:DUF2252 family protein [Novosphingobium sp.]|uniref:DUF2252 family protein n=1 Tax=Novosphingobium sp. TaxID=1874826 RepID=UPI0031E334DF
MGKSARVVQTVSPDHRGAVLVAKRHLKMARSVHAYVRGNTEKFYTWLAASPIARNLPEGPAIWICGDCHLGNLGPIADENGKVEVAIRDLDQAVIGNPAHDLIRLALSLQTAARGSDLPGIVSARMIEAMMEGYESVFRDRDGKRDDQDEPVTLRSLRRRALGRRWKHLARERLEDLDLSLPLGRKFWPLRSEEREAMATLVQSDEVHRIALTACGNTPGRQAESVRLIDAAYWCKGCSSLGQLRYAVLIAVRDAQGEETPALVDIKEAAPSVAPHRAGALMPASPADCVVTAARALSPQLGERMVAAHLLGRPVVLRELLPQDLKLEVEQFSRGEAIAAARSLAQVVGRAHARQMDASQRTVWLATLRGGHAWDIAAPSWLWAATVDLAAAHERGYLDHCRRFALKQADQAVEG